MTTPVFPKCSIVSKRSTVSLDVAPTDDEVKLLAENLLDNLPIAGPIYHYINKRLASIYMKEKQNELAVFHLTEGHGCSLRHQALYRYDKLAMHGKGSAKEIELKQKLKETISLNGEFSLEKYKGLQRRLRDLPKEWTIVQLSVQYDPLLRITHQPAKNHSVHVTRMSCGDLSQNMSTEKQGGPPVTVLFAPEPNTSGLVPVVKALLESIEDYKKHVKKILSKDTDHFNDKLKCLIKEFEQLLEDTACLLPGNLVDSRLHKEICAKVDKMVKKIVSSKEITRSQLQILYLLATSPIKLENEKSKVLNIVMENSSLASDLYKAIKALQSKQCSALCAAPRHPVIIIIDEFLDIFPIEMINVLKNSPVSRVPSVHFAHALYREHSDTVFSSGIDSKNGYYIVNPSGDLVKCEKEFRSILPSVAPKWDGIFGVAPTESQFIDAIAKKSIFLYCGHGGGNQYADTTAIERVRTQAVCFLMGCSSNKLIPLGGRVDGYSLFNSYIIGGCPCTIGMLWEVTDHDANVMTEYIMRRWLKPVESTKTNAVDEICKMAYNLNLHDLDTINDQAAEPDLLRLVLLARTKGVHIKNTAALVARGLPVKVSWT